MFYKYCCFVFMENRLKVRVGRLYIFSHAAQRGQTDSSALCRRGLLYHSHARHSGRHRKTYNKKINNKYTFIALRYVNNIKVLKSLVHNYFVLTLNSNKVFLQNFTHFA